MNNETTGRGSEVLARGEGEGALAPEVGELDHPPCEKRAGDANDAQDDLLYARRVKGLWE